MSNKVQDSFLWGLIASVLLISVYFTLVGLISGLSFAISQFATYWYFLIGLSVGFGIQVGLYKYLRLSIQGKIPKGMLATSGTTSTLAMISCCSHYLVNLLPIVGIAGIATIIVQYQIKLFWFGLIINILGIIFMLYRIEKYRKALAHE